MKKRPEFPEARRSVVREALHIGSEPGLRFFVFVAISTVIAGLGLVMDSTAVVIGAMLVAPLMTPILGLGFALVSGDGPLLGKAIRSELIGVLVALGVAILLGFSIPFIEPTSEMLSRTEPNLFDLMVAVFAGLAGAYAMVDENVSPALPGVAISTAIVPPLANCGLAITLGAYTAAMGSFLLFFTNFLSILLVSALVFNLTGMSESLVDRRGGLLVRRFGVAVIGFLLVAGLLLVELNRMMDRRILRDQVSRALQAEVADLRVSNVSDLFIERRDGRVLVLARIEAPRVIGPDRVAELQREVSERTGEDVELFLRTAITHDVSADGSTRLDQLEKLDGYYPTAEPVAATQVVQVAEQELREHLDENGVLSLQDISIIPAGGVNWLMAEISGFRPMEREEIADLEDSIRNRLGDDSIYLAILQETSVLRDRLGQFRSGFSMSRVPTVDEYATFEQLIQHAEAWGDETGFDVPFVSTNLSDATYELLLEVSGQRLFEESDLTSLKSELAKVGVPFRINVRARVEAFVGDDDAKSYSDFLNETGMDDE